MAAVESAPEQDRSRLLLEVSNAIVSPLDLKELVKSIPASLTTIIPHEGAFLTLFEDGRQNQVRVQVLNLHRTDTTPFEKVT